VERNVTHKLNSPAARAKLKAYLANDEPKKVKTPKEIMHDIKTKADFSGWCTQFPGPAKLFGMIVRRWTGSTATAPGTKGKWAAYTHREWCEITGVGSVATLKRHLDRIEEAGLIERASHRHGGTAVKSFLRPTPLGLTVANAKASDWERLGLAPPASAPGKPELETLFRELYKTTTGKFPPKLTAGQRKQLKEFADGCPDELSAHAVLTKAVTEWEDFTVEAASAAGLLTVPELPRIEFLRTHMHVAIDLFGYVPDGSSD
jgi:DNA-binding MarR family transcriptional regulator